MDRTVCSRELERDYTWDNSHASHPIAESAQGIFTPAFEGALTTSRFAALLRCPDSPQGVMLGVSVSTARKDFRNRPIHTMVFLRAETPEESNSLVAFFAECLRKPDNETLCYANSPLAKAVESLYQTKTPDEFIAFCKSLPKVEAKGSSLLQRLAIPRDSMGDRKKVADALTSLIADGSPFLLVLTDRLPTDVLDSLGTMFERGVIRIFSKEVDHTEKLPEPASQKYVRAAAIGGAVILAFLVAAVSYFRDDGPTNPGEGESKVTEVASTNAAKCGGGNGENVATNRSDAGETVSVPTINDSSREQAEAVRIDTVAATNVQQQTTAITNAPSANQITTEDERGGNTSTNRPCVGGQVPVTATNDLTQAEAEAVTIDQVAATNALLQMTAITNAPPAKPIPPSENE